MQAELNIGLLGHVDHGKTSITKMLTGTWTDVHSMEVKRGITIKLGYAEMISRKCEKCDYYTTSENCQKCGGKTISLRKISFVDAPGHETLMATVISASSILDGALLIIAANEPCPQPQTKEHKMVLEILGVKNVIVVQNKIDLVSKEKAKEHYRQIKEFLKGSIYENAPIIPVAANYNANLDALLEAIERYIPTPERNRDEKPLFFVARSFDVNKPGTPIEKLVGGVVGGSVVSGVLKVGDEIELAPGIVRIGKSSPEVVKTKIISMFAGSAKIDKAGPGGLVAIQTDLDPSLAKADGLIGNVISTRGNLPPIHNSLTIEYSLLDRVDFENSSIKEGEAIVISAGTATTLGVVEKIKKNRMDVVLKRAISAPFGSKIAISRRINQRWRLAGAGKIIETENKNK
ncbi:MAG: translation initiation factor IF-2 subunit gamma [Candidatus Micrarchaeota archaeon]|nr:translation initiation factor IF-2 subunit gamma [Candidatus Micrarchaeota archaeon]